MTRITPTDEELCKIFHRAWRKHMDFAPPWPDASDNHREGVKAGIRAILSKLAESLLEVCDKPEEPLT